MTVFLFFCIFSLLWLSLFFGLSFSTGKRQAEGMGGKDHWVLLCFYVIYLGGWINFTFLSGSKLGFQWKREIHKKNIKNNYDYDAAELQEEVIEWWKIISRGRMGRTSDFEGGVEGGSPQFLGTERRYDSHSVRGGIAWEPTSRRSRAAPGQSPHSTPGRWSSPWDTNKLSATRGRQPGRTQQCDTWRRRTLSRALAGGTGSRPQSLSSWPPWESEEHCCRGKKPCGWEQKWGASLAFDCGRGDQQVQQQVGHDWELPWDPPREGQMAWHWCVLLKSHGCRPSLRGSNLGNVAYARCPV